MGKRPGANDLGPGAWEEREGKKERKGKRKRVRERKKWILSYPHTIFSGHGNKNMPMGMDG